MNRGESAAKSISFLWVTYTYPVEWVDGPEDVPPWDKIRGFPLDVPKPNLIPLPSDDYDPEEWGLAPYYESSLAEAYERASRMIDGEKRRHDIAILRGYLRHIPGYERTAETWEPLPPPQGNYPRLVRASFSHPCLRRYCHDEDLINEIAVLEGFVEPWREGRQQLRFKNAVQKLAQRYGNPRWENVSTLEGWLMLSVWLHTHLKAFRLFETEGFESMVGELITRKNTLNRQSVRHQGVTALVLKRKQWALNQNSVSPTCSEWSPLQDVDVAQHDATPNRFAHKNVNNVAQHEDRTIQWLLSRVEKSTSPQEFRSMVADDFYRRFGALINLGRGGSRVEFDPQGTIVECDISVWLNFKLSEFWRYGRGVKVCPACGSLFALNHGNRKHCYKPGCADKSYRQRLRETGEV